MRLVPKILFWSYQFARAARYSLLNTVFGYVSHCKHKPSCGTYFWREWDRSGIKSLPKSLLRIAGCW